MNSLLESIKKLNETIQDPGHYIMSDEELDEVTKATEDYFEELFNKDVILKDVVTGFTYGPDNNPYDYSEVKNDIFRNELSLDYSELWENDLVIRIYFKRTGVDKERYGGWYSWEATAIIELPMSKLGIDVSKLTKEEYLNALNNLNKEQVLDKVRDGIEDAASNDSIDYYVEPDDGPEY